MQQDLFTFPFCSPTRETQFEPGTTGNLQAGQAKQKLEESSCQQRRASFLITWSVSTVICLGVGDAATLGFFVALLTATHFG
jgi:hypothetical protein